MAVETNELSSKEKEKMRKIRERLIAKDEVTQMQVANAVAVLHDKLEDVAKYFMENKVIFAASDCSLYIITTLLEEKVLEACFGSFNDLSQFMIQRIENIITKEEAKDNG